MVNFQKKKPKPEVHMCVTPFLGTLTSVIHILDISQFMKFFVSCQIEYGQVSLYVI